MGDFTQNINENDALATHDIFWQAYAERDLERRFAVCADDVTFFGTGHHERAVGKVQYRAMNQKGVDQYPHAFTIEMTWKEVRIHETTAWVECESAWKKTEPDHCTKDTVRLTTILKRANGRWWVTHVHGSVPDYRLHEGEYLMHAGMRNRNQQLEQEVAERTRELQAEKRRSDDLLLNILPAAVAEELKTSGSALARHHEHVTVLITDFKNFTQLSEQLSPQELVDELNACFTAFDMLLGKYHIEKIKTVGDAYLAVAGLPEPYPDHALEVVGLALDIRDYIKHRKSRGSNRAFDIRIGVHSGEVVAGIVGIRKFAYDIWGDTVNTAARLEQNCLEGHVNISATTYALVKDRFQCTYRGEIEAKNKGKLKMYFAERKVA